MGILDEPAVRVLAAVTVGTVSAACGIAFATKKLRNRVPTEWEAVGQVTDLFCYPIKSCGVVQRKEIFCGPLGLQDNLFRDRVFIVLKPNGQFVTARGIPKMLKIKPSIEGNYLVLTAPEMPKISLDINEVIAKNVKGQFDLWEAMVESIDCGDEVAQWLSTFLLGVDTGVRLKYYPKMNEPSRDVESLKGNKMWPNMTNEHAGTYHDESSYMMINQSSVDDLNSKLKGKVVSPLWFRPNIVVKGLPAFEEDKIQWFKVGERTIFKNLKPCLRCTFTTIDPETATKDEKLEPLRTLRSYRLLPGCEMSPGMGTHLGVVVQDKIKVGDTVYIPKKKSWF